jgi:hypothetical protein
MDEAGWLPFGAAGCKYPPAGMHLMGMMSHGPGGRPPENWQPPMADVNWVKRKYLDLLHDTLNTTQRLEICLSENGGGPFPLLVHLALLKILTKIHKAKLTLKKYAGACS